MELEAAELGPRYQLKAVIGKGSYGIVGYGAAVALIERQMRERFGEKYRCCYKKDWAVWAPNALC